MNEVFDYTVAIGVFNLTVQNIKELMQRCLKILFQHTNKRLIITYLNQKTKLRDITLQYFSVEELERIAEKLTKNFQIIDSVVEGDLFLILDIT